MHLPNRRIEMFSPANMLRWDTRSWLLGLALGNFAGLLLLCGGYPPSRRFLETAFPYSPDGYDAGYLLLSVGLVAGSLIFPAVLTLTAKRCYFFWGLLPIFCFTVWFAAGIMVSDRTASALIVVLASLAFALLCWIVACLSPALLRLWYRRCRLVSHQAASLVTNPRKKRLGVLAALLPAIALTILGWYNLKHPPHSRMNVQIHWEPGNEARVPLIIKHGGIFVTAILDDGPQLCQIDTGSDAVMWSRDLHLAGRLMGEQDQACNAMDDCVPSDRVKLPYIQLGSFRISGLPTQRLDLEDIPFSSSGISHPSEDAVLGNPVFSSTVLTVDYKNKLLIIQPAAYDFQKESKHPGDRVLQMAWTYHNDDTPADQEIFGWPSIRASVSGHSFWCLLDTGWEGPDLGLSEEIVHQIPALQKLPQKPVPFSSGYSDSSALQVPELEFKVQCLSPKGAPSVILKSTGTLVKSPSGGQGAVGTYLMERYRITIDYGRRRVLLEPYAKDTPERKQEN